MKKRFIFIIALIFVMAFTLTSCSCRKDSDGDEPEIIDPTTADLLKALQLPTNATIDYGTDANGREMTNVVKYDVKLNGADLAEFQSSRETRPYSGYKYYVVFDGENALGISEIGNELSFDDLTLNDILESYSELFNVPLIQQIIENIDKFTYNREKNQFEATIESASPAGGPGRMTIVVKIEGEYVVFIEAKDETAGTTTTFKLYNIGKTKVNIPDYQDHLNSLTEDKFKEIVEEARAEEIASVTMESHQDMHGMDNWFKHIVDIDNQREANTYGYDEYENTSYYCVMCNVLLDIYSEDDGESYQAKVVPMSYLDLDVLIYYLDRILEDFDFSDFEVKSYDKETKSFTIEAQNITVNDTEYSEYKIVFENGRLVELSYVYGEDVPDMSLAPGSTTFYDYNSSVVELPEFDEENITLDYSFINVLKEALTDFDLHVATFDAQIGGLDYRRGYFRDMEEGYTLFRQEKIRDLFVEPEYKDIEFYVSIDINEEYSIVYNSDEEEFIYDDSENEIGNTKNDLLSLLEMGEDATYKLDQENDYIIVEYKAFGSSNSDIYDLSFKDDHLIIIYGASSMTYIQFIYEDLLEIELPLNVGEIIDDLIHEAN